MYDYMDFDEFSTFMTYYDARTSVCRGIIPVIPRFNSNSLHLEYLEPNCKDSLAKMLLTMYTYIYIYKIIQ